MQRISMFGTTSIRALVIIFIDSVNLQPKYQGVQIKPERSNVQTLYIPFCRKNISHLKLD